MCAAAPPRAGAPCGVGDQATPANLSLPLRANASLSPCCPALSTLTHRYDTVASSGQDVEVFDGQNSTIGGVSDTAVKDWHVSPTGSPSATPVTITTPLAKCESTRRKWPGSTVACASISRPAFLGG